MSKTKCYSCIYRGGRNGDTASCAYILHTGEERRPICDPEDACTVYKKGQQLKPQIALPLYVPKATTPRKPGRWTDEDKAFALQLYQRGLADRQIAQAMGCAWQTVNRWRVRCGLEPTELEGL